MNNQTMLEVYSDMFFLRTAEEKIAEYYFNNKIFSFVHFYIGQEAVAVGVSKHLNLEDILLRWKQAVLRDKHLDQYG
jgi:TPP-dependent pyruvate/acetoin dehydrogenase alpha subunit